MSTCCIALGEPAQIRGIISKMKMDIQKKKWTSIYDKICVNWGFCAYMRMYREHGETEKLIET